MAGMAGTAQGKAAGIFNNPDHVHLDMLNSRGLNDALHLTARRAHKGQLLSHVQDVCKIHPRSLQSQGETGTQRAAFSLR